MGNTREDFDKLYEDYRGKVYRVILRLVRNPLDAEDLTQETFLKVESNLPHVKRPESVPTWLYRVATNTALDYLRRACNHSEKGITQLSLEDGQATQPILLLRRHLWTEQSQRVVSASTLTSCQSSTGVSWSGITWRVYRWPRWPK